MLGSGGVGSVGGVVTGGGSGATASVSTAPTVSLVGRGSEGSSSGVRSVGVVVGSKVGSRCVGGSLVAVMRDSAWGGMSKVVGKGVAASVASGNGDGSGIWGLLHRRFADGCC